MAKLNSTAEKKQVNQKGKQEVIEQLNVLGEGRYVVHDIPDFMNEDSRCIVKCTNTENSHGLGTEFQKPWIPTIGTLKNRIQPGCPKCAGNYRKTKAEAIQAAQDAVTSRAVQGDAEVGTLTIIGIENYKNNSSAVLLTCSIHGDCWAFGTPFKPKLAKVLHELYCCPKCSLKYKRTEQEALDEIKVVGQGKYTPLSIDDYKGISSKVYVSCDICGPGWQFSPTPWKPTIERLLQGAGCPQCSGNYNFDYQRVFLKVSSALPDNLSLVDIPEYENSESRLMLRCVVHGECWEWARPWMPSVNKVRTIKGCLKCNGQYQKTEPESLERLNQVCAEGITVVGFKVFCGNASLCLVECESHGPGWLFGHPYLPTPDIISKGHGCPKCAGLYNPTPSELICEIEALGKHRYRLVSPPVSTKAHSRVDVQCIHDNKIWSPKITQLRRGHGCPVCGRSLSNIMEVRDSLELQVLPRRVYWIHFKTSEGQSFWKIGVTQYSLSTRFLRCNLLKDSVEIVGQEYIETTNLLALLTESYVLRMFSYDSIDMQDVLKFVGGGTECFKHDVIGIDTGGLEAIFNKVKANQSEILKSFGF
ncbi:hypothetical protein [Shewanella atlantica]|uniref:CapR homology domain-containing protein n=1 Tax=Shewanella atlantica TaxID=271099 RepID=A0A3S0K3F5_9GAMM|nr:hypothetical protein [Shewanella atlantica]RTR34748.1 hypothetical protein EKG39_03565 [Shewanella atlantica]